MKIDFKIQHYTPKIDFKIITINPICVLLKNSPKVIKCIVQNPICIIPCSNNTICGKFVCGEELKISRK